MKQWYDGLSEVPGVGYVRPKGIDRTKLPGYRDNARGINHEVVGRRRTVLTWDLPNGSTSASPAHRWQTSPKANESTAQTALRQLYEVLELPGELSDYHFAIQECHETLWKHRRQEPWVVEKVVELCWLDIRLLETYPNAISNHFEAPGFMPLILAFERLRLLYQREGYLHEALDVVQRAAKLAQPKADVDILQTLIAALEAEGAA